MCWNKALECRNGIVNLMRANFSKTYFFSYFFVAANS